MKEMSVMIKPASSMCGMRCRYCFYADESKHRSVPNYGVMAEETKARLIENIFCDLQDGDRMTFAFQGGEPTLAGLSFYEDFVQRVKERQGNVSVSYAIQTNGILLDEEWCAFLKKNRFLVGLSLDGHQALHNKNRVDASGAGTFASVMAAKALLEKSGTDFNILTVLTSEAAQQPQRLWSFIKRENIRFIQFIPCLGPIEGNGSRLSPREHYSFFSCLFPLWKALIGSGKYISVSLFEEIVELFAYGRAGACGMNGRCCPQCVVEADGSAYPCDFYCMDEHRVGNLAEMTLRQVFEASAAAAFREARRELPETCLDCRFKPICNGGCKRISPSTHADPDGFCGFRALLDETLDELMDIARKAF
jgi:uncharacterized protein